MEPGNDKQKLLIENLPDAFAYHQIVTDDDGTPVDYIILEVNSAFEEMTGLKREKIIGEKVTAVLPGIEKSEFDWIGTYGKVALSGESVRFENFSEPLGRWYDVSAYSDEPGYFTTVFRDITERKMHNVILKTQQELSLDGILVIDENDKIISFNQKFSDIWGIPDDIMALQSGEKALNYVLTKLNDPEEFIRRISELSNNRQEINHEDIILKDGKVLDRYSAPMFSDKGQYYGRAWYYRDITERKQAEEALRESEEKYRHIFNHSPIGIYYTNNNGVITDCNEVFVKSMGSTYDAIVGLDILSLPDQRIVQAIKGALNGQLTTFEGVYESTTSKKKTPLRALYAPIKDSGGLVMGVVAIVEDITERKKAEDEIRTLNEDLEERVRERTAQLEAANRELDAFTYSASHDLRGPLNRISGFSEALLEDYAEALDPQGKNYLQRISNSSQHMGELIDDLLKLSRVTQHKISHEPVEMSVLVNLYLKELQSSDPARQVETVITPGLVAEGDAALLRIALENLLGNAWKYSAGEEKARIEFGSAVQEEKEVFYIRDNGTGFDMKYVEKLFAPFQRLHDAKKYPGTGVGLSIVYRIISRHGGAIWAEGEVDKGACFFFALP